jgi:predicted nucleic acid-binding protein
VTETRITPIYLDTSCAVRLFVDETQEAGAKNLARRIGELQPVALLSSVLLTLEWQAAFRTKLRGGIISEGQHKELAAAWEEFSQRRVDFWPISDAVVEAARRIVLLSRTPGRVRSLDCIHFATFLQTRELFPDAVLFSADGTMCALAQEYGVPFFNPLSA